MGIWQNGHMAIWLLGYLANFVDKIGETYINQSLNLWINLWINPSFPERIPKSGQMDKWLFNHKAIFQPFPLALSHAVQSTNYEYVMKIRVLLSGSC